MALNFPDNPTVGTTYTSGDRTWEWDGQKWETLPGTILATLPVTYNNGTIGFATDPIFTISTTVPGVTDTIYYAYTWYTQEGGNSQTEQEILFVCATNPSPFNVGDTVSVTGLDVTNANVTNKTITSINGQNVSVFVGGSNLPRFTNAYNLPGQTPVMTESSSTVLTPLELTDLAPISHTHNIADLSGTTIVSPVTGQILSYNGTKWVNSAPADTGFNPFLLMGA